MEFANPVSERAALFLGGTADQALVIAGIKREKTFRFSPCAAFAASTTRVLPILSLILLTINHSMDGCHLMPMVPMWRYSIPWTAFRV